MKKLFAVSVFSSVFLISFMVSAQGMGMGMGLRGGMEKGRGMGMRMGMKGRGMMGRGMGVHHKGMKGMHNGENGFFHKLMMAKVMLKLSDAQILNLMNIKLKYAPKFIDLQKKIVPLKLDIKKELLLDNPSIAKIEKLMKAKMAVKAQKNILGIKMRLEMQKLLNPIQKTRFKIFMLGKHGRGHRR
ncbi:MAG: hypothetical protein JXR95_10455 [Deltaproteobacteria bacterium]|nr:hypothetical protein [Deltaproteobacteria bacterium]